MVRYETDDSPVYIGYGLDHVTGVFLSVYDRRLRYQRGVPEGVNKAVVETFGGRDDGSYFDLHTGLDGLGSKVSKETIAEFLMRYGAPVQHIVELVGETIAQKVGAIRVAKKEEKKVGNVESVAATKPPTPTSTTADVDGGGEGKCCLCKKAASKRCGPCRKKSERNTFYCSSECQTVDWKKQHKHFCGLIYPEKLITGIKETAERKSIFGLLFPDNDTKPKVVEVNLVLDTFVHFIPVWVIPPAEYRRYLGPGLYDGTWFIGTPCCGKFANGYRISFRDFHQHDGSPRNESIQSLFARPEQDIPHPWAGPVLFIKMKGTELIEPIEYIDVQLTDGPDIISFFNHYGQQWQ